MFGHGRFADAHVLRDLPAGANVYFVHGYHIVRRIRERSGDALTPSEGSLYPTLHRLEAEGALEATWRDGEGGPRRRYYRLTQRGLTALESAERDWATFAGGVNRVALDGAG